MQNTLSIDEQEEKRLEKIEQENQRASAKVFRDVEFLGIRDEYFGDSRCTCGGVILINGGIGHREFCAEYK